jgi:hypothetical protein
MSLIVIPTAVPIHAVDNVVLRTKVQDRTITDAIYMDDVVKLASIDRESPDVEKFSLPPIMEVAKPSKLSIIIPASKEAAFDAL